MKATAEASLSCKNTQVGNHYPPRIILFFSPFLSSFCFIRHSFHFVIPLILLDLLPFVIPLFLFLLCSGLFGLTPNTHTYNALLHSIASAPEVLPCPALCSDYPPLNLPNPHHPSLSFFLPLLMLLQHTATLQQLYATHAI